MIFIGLKSVFNLDKPVCLSRHCTYTVYRINNLCLNFVETKYHKLVVIGFEDLNFLLQQDFIMIKNFGRHCCFF